MRPSDLTEACLEQMERSSWLNCFVTRCTDSARLEAEAADARQTNGKIFVLVNFWWCGDVSVSGVAEKEGGGAYGKASVPGIYCS